MFDNISDKLPLYGNIALWFIFIYSAGDMKWAAALASISAFYLGFLSGKNYNPNQ